MTKTNKIIATLKTISTLVFTGRIFINSKINEVIILKNKNALGTSGF